MLPRERRKRLSPGKRRVSFQICGAPAIRTLSSTFCMHACTDRGGPPFYKGFYSFLAVKGRGNRPVSYLRHRLNFSLSPLFAPHPLLFDSARKNYASRPSLIIAMYIIIACLYVCTLAQLCITVVQLKLLTSES